MSFRDAEILAIVTSQVNRIVAWLYVSPKFPGLAP